MTKLSIMEFFKIYMAVSNIILILILFINNSEATICDKETKCITSGDVMDCRLQKLSCLPSFGSSKTIRLSWNNISLLTVNDFPDKRPLNELDIGGNVIKDIEDSAFKDFEITKLILNYNFISKLTDKTFGLIKTMKHLDLSFNNISSLDANTFSGLLNLEVLNLERNPIVTIPNFLFFPLSKLRELSLRQTNLYKLDYSTFNGVTLEILNLQGNHLQHIPTDVFLRTQSLLQLVLDENPITFIDSKAFNFLPNLRSLSLKNLNSLHDIFSDAFFGLYNLQYLDLSHNKKLKFIHKNAFNGINGWETNLTEVNLRDNSLTSVDYTLLPWHHIRLIDLEDNPLVCDCNIQWMRHIQWDSELTSDLLCDSPKPLHGKLLMHVDVGQFQCPNKVFYRASTVVIGVGVSLCILLGILSLIVVYKKKCVAVVRTQQQFRYSIIDDKAVNSNSEWISPKPEEVKLASAVDV